jgi:hypothetical protein
MTGLVLELGGDLIQRVGYAAPCYDLKFSCLHGSMIIAAPVKLDRSMMAVPVCCTSDRHWMQHCGRRCSGPTR